jgi:hypothetical protein
MTKTEPGSRPDRATFLRQERPKIIAHGLPRSFLPHQQSSISRRCAAASRTGSAWPVPGRLCGLRFAPRRPQRPRGRSRGRTHAAAQHLGGGARELPDRNAAAAWCVVAFDLRRDAAGQGGRRTQAGVGWETGNLGGYCENVWVHMPFWPTGRSGPFPPSVYRIVPSRHDGSYSPN